MPEFSELSREPVREYWPDEARDFTPWLADRIDGDVACHPVEDSPERSNRSRVAVTREVDLTAESRWPEYHDWLLERGTELHDAFAGRVRELSV